ncbi:circadian-associated transcriptional repressor [Pantherophis guttatus]|uniref:Circadian-associated transcriptional repressor n=1 Tax=Pantherophis guttatus TaxID=94885 RepID=A0A6P9C9K7_PANGU|nr:circadian-associated transcriptional repressor [Pantherophis guttatus]XP_034280838.1 circadian-associated transcriptional repressor [Pantherophis guttatus]
MDDTRSISSWESFYSVESATSEEEEGEEEQLLSPKGNFRIFLLSDGKEVRLPRHRGCLNGSGFLLLPGLSGQGPKQPFGLQPPGSGCLRGPEGPGETFLSRRVSPNGSLPGQRVNRKRAEGSGGCKLQSSATGGSRPPLCPTASMSSPGIKRQRRKETEETLHSPCWTEGDQAFAQKCWELQGFVRPLLELLNRLKMGCFDQGLSSFQQSVAMDRIQRIIGVLQKPQMGERYLGTLLQVEKMLKIWYPHIPLKDSQASYSVSAREACGAAKSLCVEDQIMGSRSPSIQDDMLRPFSDLSSLEDHDVGTRQGEPVPMGNEPALNLSWIHMLPLNPLLGQVDFSQMNSTLGQILLGPNTSNCGVIFFLQKVMFAQAASKTLAHGCPPDMLFSGSGEPPRCQSLPGVLTASSSAPRGTLGGLSLLLPHLSGEKLERSEASIGKPVKCRSS